MMEAELGLMIGCPKSLDERSFIPVLELYVFQHNGMMWMQAIPVAIVVVEKEKNYLLPISKEFTLEALNTKISALSTVIQKERNKLKHTGKQRDG